MELHLCIFARSLRIPHLPIREVSTTWINKIDQYIRLSLDKDDHYSFDHMAVIWLRKSSDKEIIATVYVLMVHRNTHLMVQVFKEMIWTM